LSLSRETPYRRKRYLALAASLLVLVLGPLATDTSLRGFLLLGSFFTLALVIPALLLRGAGSPVTFAFWPRRAEPLEVFYTLLAAPLAWGALQLYFGVLSPEVPFNWTLPPEPDTGELLRLFVGINLVAGTNCFLSTYVTRCCGSFSRRARQIWRKPSSIRPSCGRWPFAGSAHCSFTFSR